MTKNEWQQLYSILDRILSDFESAYYQYKNGKNLKIRSAGGREVDSAIITADMNIRKYYEAYKLLTGIEGSDYSRAINYDEFKQARYFGGDLSKFLERIKEEIESTE